MTSVDELRRVAFKLGEAYRAPTFFAFFGCFVKGGCRDASYRLVVRVCVRAFSTHVRLFGWWLAIFFVSGGAFCAEHDHRAELHTIFP